MEGAQALLLDIDHGTYPFVTSSNSVGSYASVGTPFPHSKMGPTIGVAKAYLTRVGEGPMPSEFDGEEAEDLRKRGQEFGATTGRPRRVGALDLDALKQAVQVADCQYLVITKADILNGQNEFKYFKNSQFHVHSGWEKIGEDVSSLDANFRSYIEMIEAHVGVPVLAVGTGAGRNEILWLKNSDILWKE